MPEEFTGGLGAEGVAALRAFVEAGGTLVALDSAAVFAIDQLQLPVRNALAGVAPADFFCPGSILAAAADATQPLAHGLPETTPVWFEGSPAFEVDDRQPSSCATGTGIRSSPAGCWGRTAPGPGRARRGPPREGARRPVRLPAAVPGAEPRDLSGPAERALPLRRRALSACPPVLREHGAEPVEREGLHGAPGARHGRGAQEGVEDRLLGRLERGLEERREGLGRQQRSARAGRLVAVARRAALAPSRRRSRSRRCRC